MPPSSRPARAAPPARASRRTAARAPARAPARPGAAGSSGTLDQVLYEAIFDDVLHGRLKPGARLGEEQLGQQFDVSRTVVRQALRRLAELEIVDIVPNKGATVATPGPQETRDVFAARRAIEGAVVRTLAGRITRHQVEHLRERMTAEHAALHAGDHRRWVALAGGFHLTLADYAGNRVLARLLTELVSRCSLIVAMYEAPGEALCEHDEHRRIVDLLVLGDGEAAAAIMESHLLDLEHRLKLPG